MLFEKKEYYKLNAMELFFYYLNFHADIYLNKFIEGCLKKEGIAIDECIACAFANEYEDYDGATSC